MSIIVSSDPQKQKLLPPEGNIAARCFQIVVTGTHLDEIYGNKKKTVRLSWELPLETAVFKEGEQPKPFVVSKKYSLTLSEKSTLRKDLSSWRGKNFTDEELKGFDITKLVNAPCMLQIIHNTKDGITYANISAVSSVPKGYVVPNLFNDTLIFDVDNFDPDDFQSFPNFIKQEIMDSDEYKNRQNKSTETVSDMPF